ncbi:hypothetical protein EV182_000755, partial [Spiromyces aspiralis]
LPQYNNIDPVANSRGKLRVLDHSDLQWLEYLVYIQQPLSIASQAETCRQVTKAGECLTPSCSPGGSPSLQSQAPDPEAELHCVICQCSVGPGNLVRRLPCGHTFHLICIDQSLTKTSARCPLCRFDLLDYASRIKATAQPF